MDGFFPSQAYAGKTTKDQRRSAIARALASEVTVVPPARLLAIIGQALKWQRHAGLLPTGMAFDLFRGKAAKAEDDDESAVGTLSRTIKVSMVLLAMGASVGY